MSRPTTFLVGPNCLWGAKDARIVRFSVADPAAAGLAEGTAVVVVPRRAKTRLDGVRVSAQVRLVKVPERVAGRYLIEGVLFEGPGDMAAGSDVPRVHVGLPCGLFANLSEQRRGCDVRFSAADVAVADMAKGSYFYGYDLDEVATEAVAGMIAFRLTNSPRHEAGQWVVEATKVL